MIVHFGHHSWDSDDLLESKMALRSLVLLDGVDEETIAELDSKGMFGNLDVEAVIEELMTA